MKNTKDYNILNLFSLFDIFIAIKISKHFKRLKISFLLQRGDSSDAGKVGSMKSENDKN
jgi:hypothetical protein